MLNLHNRKIDEIGRLRKIIEDLIKEIDKEKDLKAQHTIRYIHYAYMHACVSTYIPYSSV